MAAARPRPTRSAPGPALAGLVLALALLVRPGHAAATAGAPLAPCVDGLAEAPGIAFPCSNVDLVGWLRMPNVANDIWGWTDPATGVEYALVGIQDGVAFVSLVDPADPLLVGILPTATTLSFWADIKVFADHAYVVKDEAGDHGLHVFDLRQLRDVPDPPTTFAPTRHYTGFGHAHNLAVNPDTGFLYVLGSDTCAGGLHMLDVSDPAQPVFAGCFAEAGYTHDAQCRVYDGPDAEHRGRELCFNANPRSRPFLDNTLTIVDVTDKAAPRLLSRTPYPGAAYAHQGWLTQDGAFFLLGDEGDEVRFGHGTRTYVFDVGDLDAPRFVGAHTAPSPAIDHNLYVVGEHVFEANYTAGLRIFRLSDLARAELLEVAFFDSAPDTDVPITRGGLWGVYPFFGSGLSVVSDLFLGLLVLQPQLAPAVLEVAIDVRPGSDGNPIHPASGGVVPVALLGSQALDVGSVDAATLGFGPARAAPARAASARRHDVNGDGRLDLIAHFRVRETGIAPGDPEACLDGERFDGTPFQGCDAIRTVPR